MPFPRVPEILDNIVQHLLFPRAEWDFLFQESICNFRLVARDFAYIGIRYLAPHVTLLRMPTAFDRADRIASHQTIRLYVEEITLYHDQIRLVSTRKRHRSFLKIKNTEIERFEEDGMDVSRLEAIIKKLPRLKTFRLRFIKHHGPHTEDLIAKLSGFTGFHYTSSQCINSRTLNILDALYTIPNIELYTLTAQSINRPTPACFTHLRRLKIRKHHDITLKSMPIFDTLPSLQELSYDTALTRYPRLYFKFPPSLRKLHLSGVSITQHELPLSLTLIGLSNVRLLKGNSRGWPDALQLWSEHSDVVCKGLLTGQLGHSRIHRKYDYRGPQDRLLGVSFGSVFNEICSSTSPIDPDLRYDLLKEMFGKSYICPIPPAKQSSQRVMAISQKLAQRYAEVSALAIVVPEEGQHNIVVEHRKHPVTGS